MFPKVDPGLFLSIKYPFLENNCNAGPEFQKEPPPGVKRLVMNKINADWRRLALYLDLDEHIIESIECDHSSSVHDRSWEVLKCWMRREPTGTLGDLMACLDAMGRRQLVRDIMKETSKDEVYLPS